MPYRVFFQTTSPRGIRHALGFDPGCRRYNDGEAVAPPISISSHPLLTKEGKEKAEIVNELLNTYEK